MRYTQARQAEVQNRLRVMGRVVASRSTVVASEVAGSVEEVSVRPGTRVRRGQALARLRTRPLELRLAAARGELAEAQARLRSSRLRLERLQTLAGSEVVSTQNVDDATYESQAWEGRVARASAEVERLQDDLEHSVLRAPFDGTVVEEKTQPGQWVNVGTPMVEMVSLQGLEARLDIPEDQYGALVPGTEVTVTAEASAVAVTGALRAVVPKAAERAHTFPAYVGLPVDSGLAVGMLVRGEMSLGATGSAVWVPKDAIVTQGAGHGIFVMTDELSVRWVEIRPGRVDGAWQEVDGGVAPGDFVVTHGNERLQEGAHVRAVRQEYPVR